MKQSTHRLTRDAEEEEEPREINPGLGLFVLSRGGFSEETLSRPVSTINVNTRITGKKPRAPRLQKSKERST